MMLAVSLAACGDKGAKARVPETSTAAQKYVGLVHGAELPAGIERKGWMMLDSIGGKDYAISGMTEGARRMFWLDQSADTGSTRVWKVVSVLGFDTLAAGYEATVGTCTGREIPTNEIVALTHRAGPKAAAEVLRAWRVNRRALSFDVTETAGIVCR